MPGHTDDSIMHPILAALEDAFSWTLAAPPSNPSNFEGTTPGIGQPETLWIRHDSGILARVNHQENRWFVWPDVLRDWPIAYIPRRGDTLSLEAFQADLDWAYGPEIRARQKTLLYKVRRLCVEQGARGQVWLSAETNQHDFGCVFQVYGRTDKLVLVLPEALMQELKDLHPFVQALEDRGSISWMPTFQIDLPTTQHEVLEFFQQARAESFSPAQGL